MKHKRAKQRQGLTVARRIRTRGVIISLVLVVMLAAGGLLWWGYGSNSEASIPVSGNLTLKETASGYDHTCAIASDGNAYCWGSNGSGQLGDGTFTQSNVPTPVSRSGALAALSILSISAGLNYTCAVASDHNAYCWGAGGGRQLGNNSTSNSNVPVPVDNYGALSGKTILSISTGSYHACVIASDNNAYCWGMAYDGQLGDNYATWPYAPSPSPVDTSGVLAGKSVIFISSGEFHTCAVASDGLAYCWGRNDSGQLGDNSLSNSTVPVAVSVSANLSGKVIDSVSAGGSHSCAVSTDGGAFCWGKNDRGQLGNGSYTNSKTPVRVLANYSEWGYSAALSISAGTNHSCAMVSDSRLYCWGANDSGQLANQGGDSVQYPAQAYIYGALYYNRDSQSVSSGGTHTCMIASDNQAYCFGANASGQIGDGTTNPALEPAAVLVIEKPPTAIVQSVFRTYGFSTVAAPGLPLADTNSSSVLSGISARFRVRAGITNTATNVALRLETSSSGLTHTCAIASNNLAYCWGSGANGRLGRGSTTNSNVPIPVQSSGVLAGMTIRAISGGGSHTCAIASDNNAYCWGLNTYGQLGDGTTTQSLVPVAVNRSGAFSNKTILFISAGASHTCAIASDNMAYCWGLNTYGRLGDGTTTQSLVPVAVNRPAILLGKSFLSISASSSHTCAIASDNMAYCWGLNTYGRLGDGTTTQSLVPVAVSGGLTMKSISSKDSHTCAVALSGDAYCWGINSYGQLGNNSTTQSLVPASIYNSGDLYGKKLRSIATASQHTCAIASDNALYCWGRDNYGQLGDSGGASDKTVPTVVSTAGMPTGNTILSLALGQYHTCAVGSIGRGYCWGLNTSGQLGDATTTSKFAPVPISVTGSLADATNIIPISGTQLRLEYAPKASYSVCSAVPSGSWQAVTNSSEVSFDVSQPNNGSAITSYENDPSIPGGSSGFSYQSTVRGTIASAHTFTNRATIGPMQTGLWDFVLLDRSAKSNSSYCLRMAAIPGASPAQSIDELVEYPEFTTATGSLDVQFINNSNSTISNPNIGFTGLIYSPASQTASAVLANTTTQRIEVANSSSNSGWNVTLAATGGPSAKWQSGVNNYAYDGNSVTGQLSVANASGTFTASGTTPSGATCTTTGTSVGANASFSPIISHITLASGSSSTGFNCKFALRSINLSQLIPAGQAPGNYSLPMTVTVMAQ